MQNTADINKAPEFLDRMMKNLLGIYGIPVNPDRILQGILSHCNDVETGNTNKLMRGKFSTRIRIKLQRALALGFVEGG